MEAAAPRYENSTAVRILFALVCISILPYGLQCLFNPAALKDTGLAALNGAGAVELRAMYGGFQSMAGLVAGYAVFRPQLRGSVLFVLLVWLGGSVIARIYGAAVEHDASAYTLVAIAYEFVVAALSAWFLLPAPTRNTVAG